MRKTEVFTTVIPTLSKDIQEPVRKKLKKILRNHVYKISGKYYDPSFSSLIPGRTIDHFLSGCIVTVTHFYKRTLKIKILAVGPRYALMKGRFKNKDKTPRPRGIRAIIYSDLSVLDFTPYPIENLPLHLDKATHWMEEYFKTIIS